SVGLLIMGVGYTAALAVVLALIPDHVPARRRAFASGLLGITQAFAILVGVGVAGGLAKQSLAAAFIVPGVVGLVIVLIRVLTLKDRVLPKGSVPPFRWKDFISSFYTNPFKHPDFGWAWISRFLLFLGFAGIVNYQVFFLSAQLGIAPADSAGFIQRGLLAQAVALIVASLIAGLVSDRLKRRKMFVFASAVFGAAGLTVFATATTIPQYLVGIAMVGLAQGTYYAVDLALVADVLPDRDRNAAKDLGVLSIATQGPTALIPVFAPLLLAVPFGNMVAGSTSNYTALFLGSAVFVVLAAIAILPVRGVR
ncbi:MFS transporter, partial [uncultured Amnibacterium sp.]|uniref:MFS transporter n=1 Tax=uncultured Amnibacterium sp. TaxID=1631851 RepID=UPI0035C95722